MCSLCDIEVQNDQERSVIEIVYTWPNGREEVRYRRVAGTPGAANLIDQVEWLRARDGEASPYSWRDTAEGKTATNAKGEL